MARASGRGSDAGDVTSAWRALSRGPGRRSIDMQVEGRLALDKSTQAEAAA